MRVLLILAPLFFALTSAVRAEKYALFIGVTEMQNQPRDNWLSGPVNDLREMRAVFAEKYGFKPGNILSLEKSAASRAGIERAFREHLIQKAAPGDLVVFYYSGHGTQVPDLNKDEQDGKDEALCPYDAGSTIGSYITDDDLGRWVGQLRTKNVFVMLDSCHSGTGLRGGDMPRSLEVSVKAPAPRSTAPLPSTPRGASDDLKPDGETTVLLTGCRSDQTSADSTVLLDTSDKAKVDAFLAQRKAKGKYCGDQLINPYMGALTFAFLRAAYNKPENATYTDIHKEVALTLQKMKLDQVPQLEGEGLQRLALGGGTVATEPAPTAPTAQWTTWAAKVKRVQGKTVVIEAPVGVELTRGSIYNSQSGAVLRLSQHDAQEATCALLSGMVAEGEPLREAFHFLETQKLRVALLGDATLRGSLTGRLSALKFTEVVEAKAPHEVELELLAGKDIAIKVFRNQQQLPTITGGDLDALFPKLGRVLENMATVNQLVHLENPKSKIEIDLQVNGRDFDTVKIGDTIGFTARPSQDCYLYLLDVDSVGKVTVLYPNKYAKDNKLRAGETTRLPAPNLFRLRVTGPAGSEAVKAIVTTVPINLEVLEGTNGDFSALSGAGTSIAAELLAQLKRELNRGARGIEVLPARSEQQPITVEGWATDMVFLTIRP
ncbi:caspase family protein [Armatimonas sp.]|uniref:caspase family protein n=1 Tax=Armatimonas sp. TaxID=1872638 RepID=UPI003751F1F5